MSKATADDIAKHGSISAGYLSKLLSELPPDLPITCTGRAFTCGRPDMCGGFELVFNGEMSKEIECRQN